MRRINRHRLTKTDAMIVCFQRAIDPDDGMFALDADGVGAELGITRRSVLDLVSGLVGAGVLERVILKRGSLPRWKYRFTGKPVDRRYIEVDKSGAPKIFTPSTPAAVLSTPRPPRTVRTVTAMICGDPPPGYIRR